MVNNTKQNHKKNRPVPVLAHDKTYLLKMSHAQAFGKDSALYALLPIILFSAIVILIVRLHVYSRPMSQFYWTSETDYSQLSDFFSYNKMVVIIVATVLALTVLLFQIVSQSLSVKRTLYYIPIMIYVFFVLLSYLGSDYKEFALWGYNDRFEGTIPLICYMVMLFFVINIINSEKNIKQILWPLAITSVLLSILGISQATDHDFFRTVIGQKIISPNYSLGDGTTLWQAIESAFENGEQYYRFTFQNKEIYQTVYNINYVSFYLTILLPLFGMLFIRALDKESNEPLWKKIGLGILLLLIIYNFIGSNSSGGFLGLGIIGIIGIVVLNKQLLKFWKPLVVMLIIIGIVMSMTASRWVPEVMGAFQSIKQSKEDDVALSDNEPASNKPYIDYIKTGDFVEFSINGNPLIVDYSVTDDYYAISAYDSDFNPLKMTLIGDGFRSIDDDRFYSYVKLGIASNGEDEYYLDINTAGTQHWLFTVEDGQLKYLNELGYILDLDIVEHQGFDGHYNFGSGRGYIWATSLPLIKHSLITGTGADTYCLVFPHNDYAGKYNSPFPINIIVDKPHNMYIHAAIGTGCISVIALIVLYGMYVIQSIKLFWKRDLGNSYVYYVGFGLFCGLTAFMITGLVDDSTVSVMPLFYTLLGCGISVNLMIKENTITQSI